MEVSIIYWWSKRTLTHHDASVKTLSADSDYDILSNTFENLTTRDHETILMFGIAVLCKSKIFVVGDLFNCVGFTSGTRLVALDVVAGNEDTITRNDFTRFNKGNVANNDILKFMR